MVHSPTILCANTLQNVTFKPYWFCAYSFHQISTNWRRLKLLNLTLNSMILFSPHWRKKTLSALKRFVSAPAPNHACAFYWSHCEAMVQRGARRWRRGVISHSLFFPQCKFRGKGQKIRVKCPSGAKEQERMNRDVDLVRWNSKNICIKSTNKDSWEGVNIWLYLTYPYKSAINNTISMPSIRVN